MSTEPDWKLVIAFDRDDPNFAAGFEVGMLFERLSTGRAEMVKDETVHASSEEMCRRIAATCGYDVLVERAPGMPEWIRVSFFRQAPMAVA